MRPLSFAACLLLPVCGCLGPAPVVWDSPVPAAETVERRIGAYTLRIYNDWLGNEDSSLAQLFHGRRLCWSRTGYRLFLGPKYSADLGYDVPTPKERIEDIYGRDINGDGWPELVIEEWTGGAHASFTYWIWSLRREPVCLIELPLRNGQLAISDVDYDSVPELLAHEDSFAYWHECYAASPTPTMIFRWRRGRYELATREFIGPEDPHLRKRRDELLKELRRPMSSWWLAVAASHDPGWAADGPVAQPPTELWGLMLDYIYCGEGRLARELVEEVWEPTIRGKEAFLRDFDARLRGSRYWPMVEAMTPRDRRWDAR